MSESRDQRLARIAPLLSEREVYAYDMFRSSEAAPLAPSLNLSLFQLYLQGKTTEEIRRLNPQLRLGQIVAARIEGDWDILRDEHLQELLKSASLRVQQTTLETADFICDLLAVANRQHGDRLKRYLQTGDEKELGDFRIDSLNNLKSVIETLQKLTGQDNQKKLTVSGSAIIEHRADTSILAAGRPPSADEAAAALKLLLGKGN